ncbi:MAG: BlaI/MecI/CopY family transcriptional regulator [Roseburia sp.]
MDPSNISTCERMVMKVIWDADEDLALQGVMNRVNAIYHKNWKPQTVSTFLARLVKKEFLTVYRKGRYSYYVPAVKKEEFRNCTLDENINYFDQGNAEAFACRLFEHVSLTKDAKQRIRKLIDELD